MNLKLLSIYNQIPKSTCPHGCGKCCGILLPSLAELRNVKDYCDLKHLPFKDFTLMNGDDCPYLSEEKRCLIYPVRPFLCRICGVSVDIPCPIGKCITTKLLNHSVSHYLYSSIYLHGKEKPRTEKHRKYLRELFKITEGA